MDLDLATSQRLRAFDKLLNYNPNNNKMLSFHQSNSKTRMILGGKRSGKTSASVVEVWWAALGIHPFLNYPPPPLKIRMCCVDFNTAKMIVLPMLEAWLPKRIGNFQIWDYLGEDRVVRVSNGSTIDLRSYDQDLEKFEGVERHLVAMDEEPPKNIYQSNYMRTISGGINGKLLITCTPIHGMSWLYTDLYDNVEAKAPYVEHWHVSTYENPHLDPNAIAGVLKDPAMADNVEAALHGRFFSHTGLIYPMFDVDKHVIAPLKNGIPEDWMVCVGIDPHDRNPHGIIFAALTPENVWVIFDEIMEHCIISELVARVKAKLGKRFPPNLAIIDTSAATPQSITGRSVSDELMQRYGLYVIPAHKDVQSGRLKVASLLDPGGTMKPKLYITANCNTLIRQFRHYLWDDWATRRSQKMDPKERPLKKDDHLLDALRYVVMANVVYRHPGLTKHYKSPPPDHINKVTGYY
jgi:phage terminase large subunit-like protein